MEHATRPLYAQTRAVLAALDRASAAALEPLATDDLTLLDIGTGDRPILLHTRAAVLEDLRARAGGRRESNILAYDGHPDHETGWSVLRFRRTVPDERGGAARRELCSATLLWRLTTDGWKVCRWHCTVEREEVPPS